MNRPLAPYRPSPADAGSPPNVARDINDSTPELELRPVECPSREEFVQQAFAQEAPAEPVSAPPARFRFTVLDLLVITAALSVGLAGGKWMPAGAFALFMGVVTLGGMIVVELYPPQSRGGWLAWISVVLAYLSAWISALASQT